jgi:hypothetical protein
LPVAMETSNPPDVPAGSDLLASVRAAITKVQANGYSPNLVAVSPVEAEELDLLQSSGPEELYQLATAARSINAAPLWDSS